MLRLMNNSEAKSAAVSQVAWKPLQLQDACRAASYTIVNHYFSAIFVFKVYVFKSSVFF